MINVPPELEKLIRQLEQQRDELRLKLHLATAEARDEWGRLEKQWETLRARLPQLRAAAGETAKDVGAAASLLGEELRKGYERLRKLL